MELAEPQPEIAKPKMSAIVIDDDVDVRDLFVELLQLNEVEVLATGSNGEEAFNLYKSHAPQIVFLDYLMPDYDGIYAAKKIREFDTNARIVLISGSYIEDGKFSGLIDAILKKPIEITDVMNTVGKMSYALKAQA